MQKKRENVAHAEDGIRLKKLKNSGNLRNSPPTDTNICINNSVVRPELGEIPLCSDGSWRIYRFLTADLRLSKVMCMQTWLSMKREGVFLSQSPTRVVRCALLQF